jgi:outer membrane lipoprotein LolB
MALRTGMAALLAGLVILGGCVTVPQKGASVEDWEQRRARLQQLEHFEFKGRLAAAVNNDGFNATLQWQQRREASVIDLRAPLGFGTAHIERDATRFTLQTSRGEKFDGDVALANLATRLGFAPPLDSLRYWVLGVPDPRRPAIETRGADTSTLSALEQDGWRVQYEEYRPAQAASSASAPMPRRAQLTRDAARLRLIIDEWSF